MKKLFILFLLPIFIFLFSMQVEARIGKKILKGAIAAGAGGTVGYLGAKKAEPVLEKTIPYTKAGLKKLAKKGANKVFPHISEMTEAAENVGYGMTRERHRRIANDIYSKIQKEAGLPTFLPPIK